MDFIFIEVDVLCGVALCRGARSVEPEWRSAGLFPGDTMRDGPAIPIRSSGVSTDLIVWDGS